VQEPVAPDITEKETAPLTAAANKKPTPKRAAKKSPVKKKQRVQRRSLRFKNVWPEGYGEEKEVCCQETDDQEVANEASRCKEDRGQKVRCQEIHWKEVSW
jgi:hypothetical protein